MLQLITICALLGIALLFAIQRAALPIWILALSICALLTTKFNLLGLIGNGFLWLFIAVLLVVYITPLRRHVLSNPMFNLFRRTMPSMSSTEREALLAGTVSFEAELFSGAPDFDKLLSLPKKSLNEDEEAFMKGPLRELCRMINDWDITHNKTDMPTEVWDFIKKNKFFGLIIPKQYGGLEFSATAQIQVLSTLYSCSVTVGTTVSVPNSLGPAELLLKYGTQAQKDYYLPRLALGIEIPCFALTGPSAGSDAASIPDSGVVCKGNYNGQEVLGIRLSWDKRYITLCPVATIIGVAFRLFDPDNLMGRGEDIGISLALIPANLPGVIRGRRHFPLNTGFLNGPTQGHQVFIPFDCLIGGAEKAGTGWRMLMECLSAGRAISLPSSATGGAQAGALASGAYARIRKQFNQSIANFEGIEEPLARIGGNAYLISAAISMTTQAIDNGAKPSVAGAILKYHTIERARKISMDAMDIHGGKGICLGPRNYLGRPYQNTPIGITVEGANILTRCLIIFGQGAIRCHPFVFKELESIRLNDKKAFDDAFWSHVGFSISNFAKCFLFIFTNGYLTHTPDSKLSRYYQLIHRYSAALAFLTDFSMGVLGGDLKRKEKISARLGDMVSNLYLACAVLKRFKEEGEEEYHLPFALWSCQDLLNECEVALQGIIQNFPKRWCRIFLNLILNPLFKKDLKPSDELGKRLAIILSSPNEGRTRLAPWVFLEPIENCPLGRLEAAFEKVCAVESLEKKIAVATKKGKLTSLSSFDRINEALLANIISQEEAQALQEAELARQEVIAVDDFSDDELRRGSSDIKESRSKSPKAENRKTQLPVE